MAFVKLATLLLTLLLVFHASTDSYAHVGLDMYALKESVAVQQHRVNDQDQNKNLEAAEQKVINGRGPNEQRLYPERIYKQKTPTSQKP